MTEGTSLSSENINLRISSGLNDAQTCNIDS